MSALLCDVEYSCRLLTRQIGKSRLAADEACGGHRGERLCSAASEASAQDWRRAEESGRHRGLYLKLFTEIVSFLNRGNWRMRSVKSLDRGESSLSIGRWKQQEDERFFQ